MSTQHPLYMQYRVIKKYQEINEVVPHYNICYENSQLAANRGGIPPTVLHVSGL